MITMSVTPYDSRWPLLLSDLLSKAPGIITLRFPPAKLRNENWQALQSKKSSDTASLRSEWEWSCAAEIFQKTNQAASRVNTFGCDFKNVQDGKNIEIIKKINRK